MQSRVHPCVHYQGSATISRSVRAFGSQGRSRCGRSSLRACRNTERCSQSITSRTPYLEAGIRSDNIESRQPMASRRAYRSTCQLLFTKIIRHGASCRCPNMYVSSLKFNASSLSTPQMPCDDSRTLLIAIHLLLHPDPCFTAPMRCSWRPCIAALLTLNGHKKAHRPNGTVARHVAEASPISGCVSAQHSWRTRQGGAYDQGSLLTTHTGNFRVLRWLAGTCSVPCAVRSCQSRPSIRGTEYCGIC